MGPAVGQVRIVSATATKKVLEQSVEPLVIFAANEHEFEQSERVRKAIGNRTNITTVVLVLAGGYWRQR